MLQDLEASDDIILATGLMGIQKLFVNVNIFAPGDLRRLSL